MPQMSRPVMLVILDGFGWCGAIADNAMCLARSPTLTRLWQTFGRNVGLPDEPYGCFSKRQHIAGNASTC
jgi:2,3-bisphosphoglycerate-independent phosphoglycerate mutase